jgi:hypothetical protein
MRHVPRSILMVAVLVAGCHRFYEVHGDVVINPGTLAASRMPVAICMGRGGAPETSAMYARPAHDEHMRAAAYVLCRDPSKPVRIPFAEGVYYGSLPRQMHVYAFTESVPDAQPYCDSLPGEAVIMIFAVKWKGYLRCFDRTQPSREMGFAVTYDDSKARTWTEDGGRWNEKRDIVLTSSP